MRIESSRPMPTDDRIPLHGKTIGNIDVLIVVLKGKSGYGTLLGRTA